MQRAALRATVGTAQVDIPIGAFTPGQLLTYDGTQVTTLPDSADTALVKTADQQLLNSSTLTNITDLTVALPVGSFAFDFTLLRLQTTGTRLTKIGVNFTGTTTRIAATGIFYRGNTLVPDHVCVTQASGLITLAQVTGTSGVTTVCPIVVTGTLIVTVAGTFQLQFADTVATAAQGPTIQAGSGGSVIQF